MDGSIHDLKKGLWTSAFFPHIDSLSESGCVIQADMRQQFDKSYELPGGGGCHRPELPRIYLWVPPPKKGRIFIYLFILNGSIKWIQILAM